MASKVSIGKDKEQNAYIPAQGDITHAWGAPLEPTGFKTTKTADTRETLGKSANTEFSTTAALATADSCKTDISLGIDHQLILRDTSATINYNGFWSKKCGEHELKKIALNQDFAREVNFWNSDDPIRYGLAYSQAKITSPAFNAATIAYDAGLDKLEDEGNLPGPMDRNDWNKAIPGLSRLSIKERKVFVPVNVPSTAAPQTVATQPLTVNVYTCSGTTESATRTPAAARAAVQSGLLSGKSLFLHELNNES